MKYFYSLARIFIIFSGILFHQSALAIEQTRTENRLYPIPEHGELVLDVPADWEVTYVEVGKTKPPLITFFNKDDSGQEIFQLNVSIVWDDGFKRDITSKKYILDKLKKTGEALLQTSKETNLEIHELKAAYGHGYYFNLTDAITRPGEYTHLTQGAIGTGNIVVIFSLFTRAENAVEVQQSLHMLKNASQRYQPHV